MLELLSLNEWKIWFQLLTSWCVQWKRANAEITNNNVAQISLHNIDWPVKQEGAINEALDLLPLTHSIGAGWGGGQGMQSPKEFPIGNHKPQNLWYHLHVLLHKGWPTPTLFNSSEPMSIQLYQTTEFHNVTWDKLNLKGYFMGILPPLLQVIQSTVHPLASSIWLS